VKKPSIFPIINIIINALILQVKLKNKIV